MSEVKTELGIKEQDKDKKSSKDVKTEGGEGGLNPIPYERFKEVNNKSKQLEADLEALKTKLLEKEAADEKNRQAKLKEQAKWEELAQEWESKYNETAPALESAAGELAKHQETLEKFAESQMEQVPEMFRPIVKAMPVLQRLEWLTENKDKLSAPKSSGIPPTPPGRKAPDLTDDDRRKRAARTF